MSLASAAVDIPPPPPPPTSAAQRRPATSKSKKLLQFFGDTPPIDVSVTEVLAEGFRAILHSKLPLCYFLSSLLEDYASENLFFVLEVERYEATPFTDAQSHLQAAYAVFETYLGRGSMLEINIDDRVRRSIIHELGRLGRGWAAAEARTQAAADGRAAPSSDAAIADTMAPAAMAGGLRHLFDPAKTAVMHLLESSYAKFTRASVYDRMARELSAATAPAPGSGDGADGPLVYTADAKHAALRVLAEYMRRHRLLDSALDAVPNGNGSSRAGSPAAPSPRTVTRSPAAPRPVELAPGTQPLAMHETDQDARRALLRRMLQGFAITQLGVDLVAYAAQQGY
ncbi:RGS domain-containing protein [Blastocladiella britannica]|nr:RGS domain-containing protein [Blastocladiella britannica]